MKIGLRMKERRKELKMSADELGAKIGKDRSTIYRYENGDIENLPLGALEPIAEALQTTPEYLMGWNAATPEEIKNSNIKSDIADRVFNDEMYFKLHKKTFKLNQEQLERLDEFLDLLFKEVFNEDK